MMIDSFMLFSIFFSFLSSDFEKLGFITHMVRSIPTIPLDWSCFPTQDEEKGAAEGFGLTDRLLSIDTHSTHDLSLCVHVASS